MKVLLLQCPIWVIYVSTHLCIKAHFVKAQKVHLQYFNNPHTNVRACPFSRNCHISNWSGMCKEVVIKCLNRKNCQLVGKMVNAIFQKRSGSDVSKKWKHLRWFAGKSVNDYHLHKQILSEDLECFKARTNDTNRIDGSKRNYDPEK